jgi:hypothetical protein
MHHYHDAPTQKPIPTGLAEFCATTWPDIFHRKFSFAHDEKVFTGYQSPSSWHLKAIARAVMGGCTRQAVPMEDGIGKTTMALAAAIWAVNQGVRRRPLIIASELAYHQLHEHVPKAVQIQTACDQWPRWQPDLVIIDDHESTLDDITKAAGKTVCVLLGSPEMCERLKAKGWRVE